MRLNALLLCREHQCLRTLSAGLGELGIEPDVCASAPDALELLAQRYFSALVVDFDLLSAAQVARMARLAPPERRPVVFAMIGARTDVADSFQSGANFVLYKPLALAQVSRIVLDLNEEGVAIQAADSLPSAQLPLRFILPGTSHLIEGTGEVVWADENGRAGILFKELSASSRRQLKNWMAKGNKKAATRPTTRPQKARATVSSAH